MHSALSFVDHKNHLRYYKFRAFLQSLPHSRFMLMGHTSFELPYAYNAFYRIYTSSHQDFDEEWKAFANEHIFIRSFGWLLIINRKMLNWIAVSNLLKVSLPQNIPCLLNEPQFITRLDHLSMFQVLVGSRMLPMSLLVLSESSFNPDYQHIILGLKLDIKWFLISIKQLG